VTAELAWTWLGRAGYRQVWDLQEELRRRIIAGDDGAERILFCEHDPVITLGRSARREHILASPAELDARGVEVVQTTRGGDVTVHGPGQLIIYPVVRLRRGVLAHVQDVGRAIAAELRARGVAGAACSRDPVGVFADGKKLAACGVHVSRRVAIHGWALNVTVEPLSLFELIVPCGLASVPVASLAHHVSPAHITPRDLCASLAERIALAFDRSPLLLLPSATTSIG
jgi:lipoyl(octanoyl) transferase